MFFRTAKAIHVRGDDNLTRSVVVDSVQCIVFMIIEGRIPSIKDMTSDDYGLRSIDPKDLIISNSSKMWEKRGLL